MQEFSKSTCLYHPSETITNFCKQKSCLMPLCPTCICSHLELHLKGGKSNPQFDNINDSFGGISNQIKVFSQKFEDGRNQLNTIQRTIIEQKKQLSELIYQTKVQVRELVEATFDQLQKNLQSAINKQNENLGLHLPDNLDTLQKGIIEISSKLRQMTGDLRTDRSLSTLITFNHETRANLEKYQNDIFKEIKNNEQYAPITTINQEALNRLKQAVSQVITLKFNYPQAIKQQQAIQQAQLASKVQVSQHHIQQPSGLSKINPSGLQGQNIERPPLGSSLGSRPQGIVSPTKEINPSFISGNAIKPTGIPTGSTPQQPPRISTQGLPTHQQFGGQVPSQLGASSSIDGKHRSINVGKVNQN